MAKYVRVAALSISPRSIKEKLQGQSTAEFAREWLEKNIGQVLPDKPDLIVLPECCDRPRALTPQEVREYYAERGSLVLDYIRGVAKENRCYIAYPVVRDEKDGTRRNSCIMIDRQGEVIGCYDKNHIVVTETEYYNVLPGEKETIFECDFGRVGAVICFDLNFEEIRAKYKKAKPDLMLFPSNFGGGLMRNFFAFDTQSYFVSACGYECPAEIITPLGDSVNVSTNHYNYIVEDINLDYVVCHLDFNWDKIRAAKEKYGSKLKIHDLGYIGVVMLSCETQETTVKEIVKEFKIELADDYFARSRVHREKYL